MGQYRGPEPRPELRPIDSSKLCIRSEDKLQKNIELDPQTISMYRNLENFKHKYSNAEISTDTYLEFLDNMELYKLEIFRKIVE